MPVDPPFYENKNNQLQYIFPRKQSKQHNKEKIRLITILNVSMSHHETIQTKQCRFQSVSCTRTLRMIKGGNQICVEPVNSSENGHKDL